MEQPLLSAYGGDRFSPAPGGLPADDGGKEQGCNWSIGGLKLLSCYCGPENLQNSDAEMVLRAAKPFHAFEPPTILSKPAIGPSPAHVSQAGFVSAGSPRAPAATSGAGPKTVAIPQAVKPEVQDADGRSLGAGDEVAVLQEMYASQADKHIHQGWKSFIREISPKGNVLLQFEVDKTRRWVLSHHSDRLSRIDWEDGDKLTVKKGMYLSQDNKMIEEGWKGTVYEIDDNGNLLLEFSHDKRRRWVLRHHKWKLARDVASKCCGLC